MTTTNRPLSSSSPSPNSRSTAISWIYLAAHQPAEAATEFRNILDHRGIVLGDPMDAMARLQLGRALALSGDTLKAKAAYQDFLSLWKSADQDTSLLREARAEYAKLP